MEYIDTMESKETLKLLEAHTEILAQHSEMLDMCSQLIEKLQDVVSLQQKRLDELTKLSGKEKTG